MTCGEFVCWKVDARQKERTIQESIRGARIK